MALTVGIATVMAAREVIIVITGKHKAPALAKSIEEGVNHMWTVSAIQQHPWAMVVADEDATLELRVGTGEFLMLSYTKDDKTKHHLSLSSLL